MTTLNIQQFVGVTTEWINDRDAQCAYNWPVKGGWEGWIQVDLTGYILHRDSTVDVLREQSIYQNALQRVDLLVNAPTAAANQQIPVEIKAESFENRTNFVSGVVDDVTKIAQQRRQPYDQATCAMLAVPFSPENYNQVMNIQDAAHHYIFAAVHRAEVALCIAVWQYSSGGWIPQPR